MRRIEEMTEFVALETLGTTKTTFKGHEIDLKAPWKRVKLVDELKEFDLWTKDYDDLKQRLESRGVDVSNDKTWSQLVDKAVTAYVEPRLIEPTILYDYPIELSPFARVTDDDPEIVERFEFYIGGMELGNAFTELNDAEEQEQRFAMQADEGAGGNVEAEQGDPDYVEALTYGMPPTGGLGLGIDRLAMVLAGKDSIRDVILFPAQRQKD
jgi:lysyl-tRNA synthetase class 2